MRSTLGLSRRIMEHAEARPEATPLCPPAPLHLGNRAAVDQALSRLLRSGHLMRSCVTLHAGNRRRRTARRARSSAALAWLGPEEVEDGLKAVLPTLSEAERAELAAARAGMPIWMAKPVSAHLADGWHAVPGSLAGRPARRSAC